MLSGFAGAIWVINHGFVALDAVHWSTSGLVVVMVLLGGMGTRLGPWSAPPWCCTSAISSPPGRTRGGS